MMRLLKSLVIVSVITLTACGTLPDENAGKRVATIIHDIPVAIAPKVKAEQQFMKDIEANTKFTSKRLAIDSSEITLLSSVQDFGDLALTEREGVPRRPLRDLLREFNDTHRTSAAKTLALTAEYEKKLGATFTKIVFHRSAWEQAYEKTLMASKPKSDRERYRFMFNQIKEAWVTEREAAMKRSAGTSKESLQ